MYARAIVGFLLFSVLYGLPAMFVLGLITMAHCLPTEAQIVAGETCTQPADVFFLPVAIFLLAGFVLIQAAFLRWVFRKSAN